jgi:hypothetical protein
MSMDSCPWRCSEMQPQGTQSAQRDTRVRVIILPRSAARPEGRVY